MTPDHEKIKQSILDKAKGTPENQGKSYLLRSREFTNRRFFNDFNIPSMEMVDTQDELVSTYMGDQEYLINVSDAYWKTAHAVDTDPLLSSKGRESKKEEALALALKKIDSLRAMKDFETKAVNLQNQIESTYNQRREQNKPVDKHLAYLQQKEAREYVQRTCNERKTKGEKAIDVKKELLADAVENYSPATESFIQGMLEPPYPIKVVSDEMKAKTVSRLKQVIAPVLSQQLDYTTKYEEVFEAMAHGTLESIKLEKLNNPYYSLTPASTN